MTNIYWLSLHKIKAEEHICRWINIYLITHKSRTYPASWYKKSFSKCKLLPCHTCSFIVTAAWSIRNDGFGSLISIYRPSTKLLLFIKPTSLPTDRRCQILTPGGHGTQAPWGERHLRCLRGGTKGFPEAIAAVFPADM